MTRKLWISALLVITALTVSQRPQARGDDYGRIPIYFVENQGQTDARVRYYVQGRDKLIYFTPDGLTFSLSATESGRDEAPRITARHIVKLDFVGANPDVRPAGEQVTGAVVSYFSGPREQWHTGLPTFARVVYKDLWPGIDLVYSGTIDQLKYDFLVHPYADPGAIRLAYRGASEVKLNENGELVVSTTAGSFRDKKPYVYQAMRGDQVEVMSEYEIEETGTGRVEYRFRLGPYDKSRPLVIDPAVILYSGFIGGSGSDVGAGVAVNPLGNAYVVGTTSSSASTFPDTVGPDATLSGPTDAFVVKVNESGTALIYAGYIGGSGDESAYGVAVSATGEAYVTGITSSYRDFPAVQGPDLSYNGGAWDAFVAKVNASGTALVYAGFIGGSLEDWGYAIAVNAYGEAFVGGGTSSSAGFPVIVGPDLTYGGAKDGFVAKVNASGTALVYCGYVGGAGNDSVSGVAVDSESSLHLVGSTDSTEATFLEVTGPDATHNGGTDAFVGKLFPSGTGYISLGYLGGSGTDRAYAVALYEPIAGAVHPFVTGETNSTATFPEAVGPDLTPNGGYDAFVARLGWFGEIIYAGFIGGSGNDAGRGIAVVNGWPVITGETSSTQATFPVVEGPDATFDGGLTDAWVARVNGDGTALLFSGYIGGSGADRGKGVAIDSSGRIYVVGETTSGSSFPVSVGPDSSFNGGSTDAFITRLQYTP